MIDLVSCQSHTNEKKNEANRVSSEKATQTFPFITIDQVLSLGLT